MITNSRARRMPTGFRRGFTLIELLTVIGIITILIAILLPVMSKVLQAARVSYTKQAISSLSIAIEGYQQSDLSGQYPGVLPNTSVLGGTGTMVTFTPTGGGTAFTPTATENMILALCGGLVAPTTANGPVTYNATDLYNGKGPLNLTSNVYTQTRHTPYFPAVPGQNMPNTTITDASGNTLVPWGSDNSGITGDINATTHDSMVPEVIDRFTAFNNGGRPIIYMRANPGNPTANASGNIVYADDTSTQYNYNELAPYAIAGRGDFYGLGSSLGTPFTGKFASYSTQDPTLNNSDAQPYAQIPTPRPSNLPAGWTNWDYYLQATTTTPRGAGKYILISAGADGIFGTQDDIIFPF